MKSKSKKQANKSLTFIIIPPGIGKTWRLNVKKNLLAGILSVLMVVAGASLTISYLYYDSQNEIQQVNNLKASNQEKDQLIESLNNSIDNIESQRKSIESKQEQLKKMMGVGTETTNSQPSRGGQGGAEIHIDINDQGGALQRAQAISTSLYRQEKELDEMIARVGNNKEYFLSIPNKWPVEGELTSEFGWRNSPFGGRSSSFHNGIDIANNVGTEIFAAADGTVTSAGWQGAYGKTVEIDHGYGFKTMYGHNYVLLVEAGEEVEKGQVIAKMGNTGRSTGPHLHFSIFKNGQALNPMVYLPDL